MKKVWAGLAVLGIAALGLAACSNSTKKTSDSSPTTSKTAKMTDKLVVYSPNSEGLINATIPAFEEKYGVKVDLIQAGTGELFKKLESEKGAPVADVIFGGS